MNEIIEFFTQNKDMIFIVVLMVFVGVEVIGKVPAVLHTPLMSGANAIHGVVVVGAIIVMLNSEPTNYVAMVLGFIAVFLGTLNVVGGFVVACVAELFDEVGGEVHRGDVFGGYGMCGSCHAVVSIVVVHANYVIMQVVVSVVVGCIVAVIVSDAHDVV